MVLTVLFGVVIPILCLAACILVGRYYVRRCEQCLNSCAEVDERVDYLIEEFEREQRERTEFIPRVRDDDSPLQTRGQRKRAEGSRTGSHTLSHKTSDDITDKPKRH
jgi:hypothetical protein